MRVAPRWKGTRVGRIDDIACFVPGEVARDRGRRHRTGGGAGDDDGLPRVDHLPEPGAAGRPTACVEASREHSAPRAAVPRLRAGVRRRPRLLPDRRASSSDQEHDVDLPHSGTITNFTIITPVQYPGQTETEPFARVFVLLDGTDVMLPYSPVDRPAASRTCTSASGSRAAWATPRTTTIDDGGDMGGAYGHLIGWMPTRRTRRRRPRPREPDLLMATRPSDTTSPSSGGPRRPMERRTDLLRDPAAPATSSPTRSSRSALTRADVDFTCLGSCDYITGQAFSFVSNLDAIGAWPPKRDSHVEMDGAWALYEAWLRLQEGDIEIAVVTGSGRSSTGDPSLIYPMEMDPYYLAPLGADPLTFAALQARAVIDAGHRRRARDGRGRAGPRDARQPDAQVRATDVDALLADDYVREPLRRHDLPPITDGAAAMVLATGDRARELVERPAYITGFDHRTECHNPSFRALADSPSTRIAAAAAGLGDGPVEVAELQAAFTHEELLLRSVLGLGDDVDGEPRRAARCASNPIMATGLVPHRVRGRPRLRRRQPGARPLDVGPVPATEPDLHPGGTRHERRTVRDRRRGPDPPQVAPARRLVRRARARGGVPRPRRRPHDVRRHRRGRPRQGARPLRGRDEARALPVGRARRGRQADVPRAHRRLGRRHDRASSPRRTCRPASTERVLAVAFEKQSEGNAQFALGSGRGASLGAGGAFAPFIRAYIHRSGAPEHIGWKVAVKDRLNALEEPVRAPEDRRTSRSRR